jgi:hypothetical protein
MRKIGYGRGSKSYGKNYGSYGTGYGGGYSSYGYGGGYGGYSSGSLWSWGVSKKHSSFSDDNELYVREPDNYITPLASDIESEVLCTSQEKIDQIKEIARVCYFKMIGDKNYLEQKYTDLSKLSDEDQAIVKKKQSFYDEIYNKYIPGWTPLEQAVAIYNSLTEINNRKGQEREKTDEELNPEALNFDRRAYTDVDINDQLELNDHSKSRKMSILNLVSLVGSFGNEFKVEKEVKEKIVTNSDVYAKKMLRDYSQIANIDLYQRLLPHFDSKLLTKDLIVNVPVDKKEQKQKIIILLDYSGSMDEVFKQDWVNAILIDRFRYVMKGEAEVFFSYFVDDPSDLEFNHIKDRKDVIDFWSHFSNRPNGGETHIGDIVNHVSDEIINKKRLHNLNIDLSKEKPEILIINDGNDTVKTKNFPYKVNSICLSMKNEELKNLCIETKGKQIAVYKDNSITAFSKEGEQTIN